MKLLLAIAAVVAGFVGDMLLGDGHHVRAVLLWSHEMAGNLSDLGQSMLDRVTR